MGCPRQSGVILLLPQKETRPVQGPCLRGGVSGDEMEVDFTLVLSKLNAIFFLIVYINNKSMLGFFSK